MLNYGAATNWAFARIGAMTGSNAESSLEAFGNAMRDRRWIENVASDAEVAGILDRLAQRAERGRHRHRHPQRLCPGRRRAGTDRGVPTGGGA